MYCSWFHSALVAVMKHCTEYILTLKNALSLIMEACRYGYLTKTGSYNEVAWQLGVRIDTPEKLNNEKQFPGLEDISNRRNAQARVHVKRTNWRVKLLWMLKTATPIRYDHFCWQHRVGFLLCLQCIMLELWSFIFNDLEKLAVCQLGFFRF